MAGRRVEGDSRNDLINSYIQFIDLVQPKLIFFENVRGFTQGFKKNNKKGKAYSTYVIEELKKKGYTVQGHLINFADYGVPQKRTRFILVGIKNEFVNENPLLNKETFFNKIADNKKQFLIKL